MHVSKCKLCVIKIVVGTNEIKQANDITLEKDYMPLCPKKNLFHTNNFLKFSSANCMKNAYNVLCR